VLRGGGESRERGAEVQRAALVRYEKPAEHKRNKRE